MHVNRLAELLPDDASDVEPDEPAEDMYTAVRRFISESEPPKTDLRDVVADLERRVQKLEQQQTRKDRCP